MTNEGERLKHYLDLKGVESIRKFCLENDISYNSFHQILSGTRQIGLNTLKQVADVYPNLNMNWVIFGKGTIEVDTQNNYQLMEPSSRYEEKAIGFETFLKFLGYPESKKLIAQIIKEINNHG